MAGPVLASLIVYLAISLFRQALNQYGVTVGLRVVLFWLLGAAGYLFILQMVAKSHVTDLFELARKFLSSNKLRI